MVYLEKFVFPDEDEEYDFLLANKKRTCYNTVYPFGVLSARGFREVNFQSVTIFYGGNGAGKSTALNVIAEKLSLARGAAFNRSDFYGAYLDLCFFAGHIPPESRVVTSDDVFDFMLSLRALNDGIDGRRQELFDEYVRAQGNHSFRMRSLDDYEGLKNLTDAWKKTQSKYVKERLQPNVREHSNGESAFAYFTEKIDCDALYLLDEPENSLSPERQRELARFLSDAARFFGCQIVLSTHSPFLLSMAGARIYNLDESPVCLSKWTELKNVRAYFDFFEEHKKEFC